MDTITIATKTGAETVLLTSCCNAYDTYWGDTHVCRKCHGEWPEMVEVEEPAQVEAA